MNITADTNVLLRVILDDDMQQQASAKDALAQADLVAVPTAVFCELAWVLSRSYEKSRVEIASVIRALIDAAKIRVDTPAITAGLASLDAGGDFADGIIAFDGRRLGGAVFVSFDRRAVKLFKQGGGAVRHLGASS